MRWALLGASSGLGLAFLKLLLKTNEQVLSVSRKAEGGGKVQAMKADFSKSEQWEVIIQEILKFQPDYVIYFAGGGPYGNFIDKKFSDHQWALKVNFEFPAFLIHQLQKNQIPKGKLVCIGSAIAESHPDPQAASYAAAKHALRGLITSLQKEGLTAVHLWSPGYMDTPLLPMNAWPRKKEGLVKSPFEEAQKLLSWALDPS